MGKEDYINMEGKVVEILPNSKFKVMLTNNHIINAYISGKIRKRYIRILKNDTVKVEVNAYDPTQGRIVYRM